MPPRFHLAWRDKLKATHPIQMHIDTPIRIDRRHFSTQRDYFSEDADDLVGEGVEVFGVDAGSGFGRHGTTTDVEGIVVLGESGNAGSFFDRYTGV